MSRDGWVALPGGIGFVCGSWLWYFLIILTYYFQHSILTWHSISPFSSRHWVWDWMPNMLGNAILACKSNFGNEFHTQDFMLQAKFTHSRIKRTLNYLGNSLPISNLWLNTTLGLNTNIGIEYQAWDWIPNMFVYVILASKTQTWNWIPYPRLHTPSYISSAHSAHLSAQNRVPIYYFSTDAMMQYFKVWIYMLLECALHTWWYSFNKRLSWQDKASYFTHVCLRNKCSRDFDFVIAYATKRNMLRRASCTCSPQTLLLAYTKYRRSWRLRKSWNSYL